MSAQDDGGGSGGEVAEFAALLRALKERTDRSYGSLARRLGMNTSTLHRYCAGDAVPLDFAPVERFAALCGATSQERVELHRCWLGAVAVRRRPRAAEAAEAAESVHDAAEGPDAGVEGIPVPEGASAAGMAASPLPLPGRPWYRRRRVVVGLASVGAVFGMLGALSALPDGRRASAGGPVRVGVPAVSGSAEARAPERRGTSPGPSGTPASGRPSGSATPQKEPGASRPPGAAASAPSGGGQDAGGLPFAWSVNSQAWKLGCGHDYVIAQPPGRVPPPPVPQDAAPWAAAQGAVHGGETLVQLSVQGRSETAVVLEALRVRVVGRAAPVEGNAYAMDQGCGGSLTPRYFAVDLDRDRPIARAVAGNDSGTPIPAVRLPYRVSAEDPEVLLITAEAGSCDCRWYLELDWSSQGRTGTVRVDDGGRPFRTSGIEGLPRYMYDTVGRRWGPYS
ncbi:MULTISPECIES: helix-turn-helix domain-containing protein [unclassified Streptomyces]|uniref:helix-turn-helix domain-containing protein n=1 Tax=unclassified Streptomyces TaxID=2593676 RepID=UPI0035DFD90A